MTSNISSFGMPHGLISYDIIVSIIKELWSLGDNLMLAKINKIKSWQVACVIAILGLGVFFVGLNNPFQGDDAYQIVNNTPVHSISNIVLFFKSSTFYNGQQLIGNYYRPLMTTVFSLIYTLFGQHTFAFHLFQLLLYLSSAFILYLFFRYFFKPALAIFLVLIFLVHPLNSQVVYSIPTMQDALFFFFGILALWLLARFKSTRSLLAVAGCLLLSLLSKETGIVFTAISLLYLLWFSRERLYKFLGIMLLPIAFYLILKSNAVGLLVANYKIAPIDKLNFTGRLLTTPSIVLFYIGKFILPASLATGYFWVNPTFSVNNVLLPLIIDLVVIGLFIYMGVRVHNKLPRDKYHAYLFFAAWAVIGIAPYLQIVPLDMTACETWPYFSMAGVLGMIGVALMTIKIRVKPILPIVMAVLLISLLGTRTIARGTDYSSQYKLAMHDLAVSKDNYGAMNNIAQGLIDMGKYKEAVGYARRSVDVFPAVTSYDNLGVALQDSGDYLGAIKAYNNALKYGSLSIIYENLGIIALATGNQSLDINKSLEKALKIYPQDYKLWVYLAILEDEQGNNADAKIAISNAVKYGPIPQTIYVPIMTNKPFTLKLPNSSSPIVIR